MKAFDRKFGPELLATVPREPGVYRMLDKSERVIYVGKAKNLRRRLGQYRNARRCKADAKMRKIVGSAERVEWQSCATELEASLLEISLIQQLRPRWNVAGAFSFLYPLIGLRESGGTHWFCFSSAPETAPAFRFHGAYRSREIAGEAFFAWMRLLRYVGPPAGKRETLALREGTRRTYVFGFRGLPEDWPGKWDSFLRGESNEALEELVLALLENAAARRRAKLIQDDLNAIRRFWRHEAVLLRRARKASGFADYPVSQKERDPVFLKYRAALMARRHSVNALAKGCPA